MSNVSSTTLNQSISSLSTTNKSNTTTDNTNSLGKDQFLQLLVTQLKYQDPMNPMDDKEFIGQMAQFSSLEQMQNLNATFSSTKALNMVGKYVTAKVIENDTQQEVKGDVESVRVSGSSAFVVVDGKEIPIEDVTEVKERSDMQYYVDLSKYTDLIGKNVKSVVEGIKENEVFATQGTVHSVSAAGNQPIVLLNNIQATIDSLVLSAEEKEKVTTIKEYLQNNIGKSITAIIVDSAGKTAKVTGEISTVDGSDSNPNVTFNNVPVAVDSIYEIF